jgi:hypothetical protein
MRASIAFGLLLFASSAASADEPVRRADAPPPSLAAGDALGLALFGDLSGAPEAPAPESEPAPPAAQAEE